jgi:NADP-dependent 3-hydroxy acid dehydrogenase YdfG
MSSIAEKVVVITGASSGIGAATAELLAKNGAKLMLAARREDRLTDLVKKISAEGGTASCLVTDVTDLDQVKALAEETIKHYGHIDVLVNNAGLMPLSRLVETKVDEWNRMIDVNIKGVLNGIAAVLPGMMARKSGHVINISSVAGHKVMAGAAVYCGTKFAVRAISEGLRLEAGKHVRSTIICPGAVMTELPSTISNPDVKHLIEGVYQAEAIDPISIAKAIVFAMEQPDDVDVNEIVVRPTRQEF